MLNALIETVKTVNKLAQSDKRFEISSKDLAEAISRVGDSAKEAGVSFEELLTLIAQTQQITGRGGAVIGNSLKTIFTRLQREDVLKELCWLGVDVSKDKKTDATVILKDLAIKFDSMNLADMFEVVEILGGVFQANQLRAIFASLK